MPQKRSLNRQEPPYLFKLHFSAQRFISLQMARFFVLVVIDDPLPDQRIAGSHDIPQKIKPLLRFSQSSAVSQTQTEAFGQIRLYPLFGFCKLFFFFGKEYKIIHITQIALDLQLPLDKVIKTVHVDIGEKLTCEVAYGQPQVRGKFKKRFMRRQSV